MNTGPQKGKGVCDANFARLSMPISPGSPDISVPTVSELLCEARWDGGQRDGFHALGCDGGV